MDKLDFALSISLSAMKILWKESNHSILKTGTLTLNMKPKRVFLSGFADLLRIASRLEAKSKTLYFL